MKSVRSAKKSDGKIDSTIARKLKRTAILVVGDVMLNERIEGVTERMSPESPATPVVKTTFTGFTLGGAAQAAANISSIGARAFLSGVVGKDSAGGTIRKLMKKQGIGDLLIEDSSRPTTLKTRIFRGSEHLLRVDNESVESLSPKSTRAILSKIKKISGHIDFVIVSDYAKGVLSPELLSGLKKIFGPEKIIADIKPKNAPFVRGIRLLKPNKQEAEAMLRYRIENLDHAHAAAAELAECQSSSILITLGSDGLILRDRISDIIRHFPANPTELVDVTGAGDIVISTLAALLAIDLDLTEATRLANAAAAVAVSKPGAAVVTLAEILEKSARS